MASNRIDPTPPPAPSRGPGPERARTIRKVAVAASVVGLVVLFIAVLVVLPGRREREREVENAERLREHLAQAPLDAGNGFSVVSAERDGDATVSILRAEPATAEALRDPAAAARFREAELQAMRDACIKYAPLVEAVGSTTRRYLSDTGAPMFEIRLGADCRP